MRRRVVITGLGAVTAAGIGVKRFWHALREGISGIDTITRFDPGPYPCKVAAEVKGFEPEALLTNRVGLTMGRVAQMGGAAARMAYDDAALASVPGASRFAVCFT